MENRWNSDVVEWLFQWKECGLLPNKIFSRARDLKILAGATNWHLMATDTRVHAMFSLNVSRLMTGHM
jgi:hypothetical protein